MTEDEKAERASRSILVIAGSDERYYYLNPHPETWTIQDIIEIRAVLFLNAHTVQPGSDLVRYDDWTENRAWLWLDSLRRLMGITSHEAEVPRR